MICFDLRGYHHFGKLPCQPCIRPESVFGGNATIKGHVFAVVEACQSVFVRVADRFSSYLRESHACNQSSGRCEESAKHVKADRDVSLAEFDTPYPQGVQA